MLVLLLPRRRLKKSTKETDRRKARIIGEAFEVSEHLVKRGNATEEQIRKVIKRDPCSGDREASL
jgi:hypothetical protein